MRKENPNAFIKCFSSSAISICGAHGSQPKVENLMKHLQVDHLFLYPRIKLSIKQTLDDLAQLKIKEYEIEFSTTTYKIH
jgi:hypothetical protein